eukprot:9581379-Lingulodinium_polyedra.AAC.1
MELDRGRDGGMVLGLAQVSKIEHTAARIHNIGQPGRIHDIVNGVGEAGPHAPRGIRRAL